MVAENLWGALPPADDAQSPSAILKAQAALLSETTNDNLRGVTSSERASGKLVTELSIRVYDMNNYEISLVRASHGAVMYPASLYNLLEDEYKALECHDEGEFKEVLGGILKSEKVQKVIASLLAQIRN